MEFFKQEKLKELAEQNRLEIQAEEEAKAERAKVMEEELLRIKEEDEALKKDLSTELEKATGLN